MITSDPVAADRFLFTPPPRPMLTVAAEPDDGAVAVAPAAAADATLPTASLTALEFTADSFETITARATYVLTGDAATAPRVQVPLAWDPPAACAAAVETNAVARLVSDQVTSSLTGLVDTMAAQIRSTLTQTIYLRVTFPAVGTVAWPTDLCLGTSSDNIRFTTTSTAINQYLRVDFPTLDPAEVRRRRLQEVLRSRHAPAAQVPLRQGVQRVAEIREQRARETLRRVVGEARFRGFLRHGFVSLKARSGRVYQIFPGHKLTNVYDRGVLVDRQCVILTGDFAPSDSLIMRFLLLVNDEREFERLAVRHPVPTRAAVNRTADARDLVTIYDEIKAARYAPPVQVARHLLKAV